MEHPQPNSIATVATTLPSRGVFCLWYRLRKNRFRERSRARYRKDVTTRLVGVHRKAVKNMSTFAVVTSKKRVQPNRTHSRSTLTIQHISMTSHHFGCFFWLCVKFHLGRVLASLPLTSGITIHTTDVHHYNQQQPLRYHCNHQQRRQQQAPSQQHAHSQPRYKFEGGALQQVVNRAVPRGAGLPYRALHPAPDQGCLPGFHGPSRTNVRNGVGLLHESRRLWAKTYI